MLIFFSLGLIEFRHSEELEQLDYSGCEWCGSGNGRSEYDKYSAVLNGVSISIYGKGQPNQFYFRPTKLSRFKSKGSFVYEFKTNLYIYVGLRVLILLLLSCWGVLLLVNSQTDVIKEAIKTKEAKINGMNRAHR